MLHRQAHKSDKLPKLTTLVSADYIISRDGYKLAVIRAHCGSQFLLQGIPCLVASLQVTPNKRSNIFARILIKTVITNLLLDMVLQRAADFDVNAT
ncbi:hypothetical protein AGRO_1902 [Agrobacterium sp. ATCC 31749]|nr:hypothetical protein AGRO_1902 [Agrobacterium sp. ATCC 31749]